MFSLSPSCPWRSSSPWLTTSRPWSSLSGTAKYCARRGWSPRSWPTVGACCWLQTTHCISLLHGSWRSSPPRPSHTQTSGETDSAVSTYCCRGDEEAFGFIHFCFVYVFFFVLLPLQEVLVFGATAHVLGRQNGHAVATRLSST